jgi:hypothetical protein
MKQVFETDYEKRTGIKAKFVEVKDGRVYFKYNGVLFSGKCNGKGRIINIQGQRVEKFLNIK